MNNNISFILDHNLKEYRIPFFEALAESYNVTVFHNGPFIHGISFRQKIIQKLSLGPFYFFEDTKENNIGTDVLVIMGNLRMLNLYFETLNPFIDYKIIHWGIGVSSGNGLQTKKNISSWIRNALALVADGLAFYSEYPLKFYLKKNQQKSIVVGNAIKNNLSKNLSEYNKDSFLFIGSLHQRKGIDILLYAFQKYLSSNRKIKNLIIIGDGNEKKPLSELTRELDINDNVLFTGHLGSEKEKLSYFKKTVVSISPNQAGLSVLESFSFGIPFVTKLNPISGGEFLNIIPQKTGFLFNGKIDDLANLLIYIDQHPKEMKIMGNNAFKHYKHHMNMNIMVNNFKKIIDKCL